MARRKGGRARGGAQSGNLVRVQTTNMHEGSHRSSAVGNHLPSDDFIPIVDTNPKFSTDTSPIKPLRLTRTSFSKLPSNAPTPAKNNKTGSPSRAGPLPNVPNKLSSPKKSSNESNKRVLRSSSRGRGEPESKKKRASDGVSIPVDHTDVIDLVVSDESNPPAESPRKVVATNPMFPAAEAADNVAARASGDISAKLFVVIDGHRPGVYKTAIEAWGQIDGYQKAFVKTFNNESDAHFFLQTYRNMQSSTITQSTVIDTCNSNQRGSGQDSVNSRFNFQPSCNGTFGKSKGHADIYTDGSFEVKGNKGGIGVYWGPNDPRNVSEPLEGFSSSNRAEICAAIRGIRDAKAQGYSSVAVHTDSQFMINSIRQWVDDHISKKKRKCIDGVLERDLLDLVDAITGLAITWVKVKGHSGNEGNEAADKLAKAGRERYIKYVGPMPTTRPKSKAKVLLERFRKPVGRPPGQAAAQSTDAYFNGPFPNTYWKSFYDASLTNPIAPPFPYQ